MLAQQLDTDQELLGPADNAFWYALEGYYITGLYPIVITTAQVVT